MENEQNKDYNSKQLDNISESLKSISQALNKDSQAELYHSETHCPSCGRFVGTETRCPYCQTETNKRLSIRIFKIISVLISTVGLLMLLFYAQTIKTPEAKITELGPLTNFAHVRIVGYADRDASVSKWGTLSFNVIQFYNDKGELVTDINSIKGCEKKEIRVTAYKKVAELIKDEQMPRRDEEVEVEGQVRVQQGEASLLINAPEHINAIYDKTKERRPLQANQPFNSQFKKPFKKVDSNIPYTKPEEINESLIKKNVKVIATVKSALKVENDCVIIRI